jgi:cell volume regulation protein A
VDLAEPFTTASLFVVTGALMTLAILLSRVSGRLGVPVFLVFLGLGMLAGSDGPIGIAFDDYRMSFRWGTVALALILFDGGLNTSLDAVRRGLAPAGVLATVGVAGTAGIVALGAYALGFDWAPALLLGAVVSSTDAAAVFSVLRSSGIQMHHRVGTTLELESGLNDPVAVILTIGLTEAIVSGTPLSAWTLVDVPIQLGIGAASGAALGLGGRWLLQTARLPAAGLYAVLTSAIALLAYGLPTVLGGSGFLSVYVCAVAIGNARIPNRSTVVRFHDAAAWLGQVGMFLLLGLLVYPSHLGAVAGIGLGIALLLAFVARPLVVTLCLLPFGFNRREIACVGWVGLRGAVPIILATFPVMAGVPGAERLFDVVFFVVVVNALLPGATVAWTTRKLALLSNEPPPPQAVLEINSTQALDGELVSFYVSPALVVAGIRVSELPLPEGCRVLLIVRGGSLIAPEGSTVLAVGDHVYLFFRPKDRPLVQLLFGHEEVA